MLGGIMTICRGSKRKAQWHSGTLVVPLLVLLFMFLLTKPGNAQVLYGSIVGTVTDSTGAVIPGASVTVTQMQTSDTRSVTSNDGGVYTVSTVPAGTYSVSVSKEGFATFTSTNIAVAINTTVRVNANLTVGAQAEKVTVSASGSVELQTDRVDVHGEISAVTLEDLPQPTRVYEGLVGTLPGVAPPSASGGGTNNPMRSMIIQANGTSASATNVSIDGVSATNAWVQFFSTAVPSIEAVETVNVVTGSSGADQGAINGAAIQVQIKSGTNSLHGSAYEYFQNNTLKANPYFSPAGTRKPK